MFLITLEEIQKYAILLFYFILNYFLIPFISNPDYSSDFFSFCIFIISSISSFVVINVAVSDSKMFFWITTSVADAATVNPNEIELHLAVFSSFLINGKT